ncbi:hypothetical protein [Paraburkholderia lacunae]|uniref:hypothetical protein n=1 Tax=Paraburkholderia lacunae TaxID=2211104 RepID=UPI001401F193|nr:hypothetical protein [Paraburkholderia lacunae]
MTESSGRTGTVANADSSRSVARSSRCCCNASWIRPSHGALSISVTGIHAGSGGGVVRHVWQQRFDARRFAASRRDVEALPRDHLAAARPLALKAQTFKRVERVLGLDNVPARDRHHQQCNEFRYRGERDVLFELRREAFRCVQFLQKACA